MYYDTTLQQAFARGLKAHPDDLPTTCKLTFINGRYLQSEYSGTFYSKAQNLGRELIKAYDKVLENYDVLLMPTVPKKAPTFPPANSSLEGKGKRKDPLTWTSSSLWKCTRSRDTCSSGSRPHPFSSLLLPHPLVKERVRQHSLHLLWSTSE